MKVDHEKYVDIKMIVDRFGYEICLKLPHIHGMTGCDTRSYMFGVGKVKVLKKIEKDPSQLHLLIDLGSKNSFKEDAQQNVIKFIQCVCYNGKLGETLVDTRFSMYKAMKIKSSQSLLADPDSMIQHVLRAHYQLYYWLLFKGELTFGNCFSKFL